MVVVLVFSVRSWLGKAEANRDEGNGESNMINICFQ